MASDAARVADGEVGKRPLLQFSLRSLMLAVSAFALLFAWIRVELDRRRQILQGHEIVVDALERLHCGSSSKQLLHEIGLCRHPLDERVMMIDLSPVRDSIDAWDEYERQLLTRCSLGDSAASSVDVQAKERTLRWLAETDQLVYYEVVRSAKTCRHCHEEFCEGQVMVIFKTTISSCPSQEPYPTIGEEKLTATRDVNGTKQKKAENGSNIGKLGNFQSGGEG